MFLLCKLLAVNVKWTKTDTREALTARVEPSSDVGNVGATFDTVAHFLVKPPNQSTADTELNDASVGKKAQTMGTATKNNANGMVLDNVPITNDGKLIRLASNVARQDRREECSLDKTGTTMFCWFLFDCLLHVLMKIF